MARYIDADEALRMMRDSKKDKPSYGNWDIAHDCCIDCVNTVPTADVVEAETIKAWLYEMAINNVGCDGDFSNACKEIIARLDGLRNFAKERGGRSEI